MRCTSLLYGVLKVKVADFIIDTDMNIEQKASQLSQTQRWLIQTHKLYTFPNVNCLGLWYAEAVDLNTLDDLISDGEMFDTYEKALEHGIDFCLARVRLENKIK